MKKEVLWWVAWRKAKNAAKTDARQNYAAEREEVARQRIVVKLLAETDAMLGKGKEHE